MGAVEKLLLFLKFLCFTVAGLLRRAACFVKKKKIDDEGDPTSVVIVSNKQYSQLSGGQNETNGYSSNFANNYTNTNVPAQEADLQMTDWNSWGNENVANNAQETTGGTPTQDDQDVDFFRDMEPKVKVNKVLVKKKQQRHSPSSNRLAVNQDLDFKITGELDEWADDQEAGGWDDEDAFDVDEAQVLKEAQEQRRLERQMRAKQQRQEKNLSRHHAQKLAQKVA